MCKPSLFGRALTLTEIADLHNEEVYGPIIPSDLFVRVFGMRHMTNTAWYLTASDLGCNANNVVDDTPSTIYRSNRHGRQGIVPGGTAYNRGDVETCLYQEAGGFISGNAVFIDGCNATDVAIYGQDTDPALTGWGAAALIATAQLHYADEDNDIPLNVYHDLAGGLVDGVVSSSNGTWREGVYAGRRVYVYVGTNPDHYNVAADATQNQAAIVKYNSDNRLQLKDMTMNSGAAELWVRLASDKLIVTFTDATYRYWRFVFTNNLRNGDNIHVGTIKVGHHMIMSDNPDMDMTVATSNVQRDLSNNSVHSMLPWQVRRRFDLSFTYNKINTSSAVPLMLRHVLSGAIQRSCPVYLTAGIQDDRDSSSLVYACTVSGELAIKTEQFPHETIAAKLEEI